MNNADYIKRIEEILTEFGENLDQILKRNFSDGVRKTVTLAKQDFPSSFFKARFVLETIVGDMYRREFADSKNKETGLYKQIAALFDLGIFPEHSNVLNHVNSIRINANLIAHDQGKNVDISEDDLEIVILQVINFIRWYITGYIPSKTGISYQTTHLSIPTCPYRGLAAFREQDQSCFFGRDRDTEELIELAKKQSFLTLIGNSGSGKSSLVYAGLIPVLRQQGWQIAPLCQNSCRL